MKNNASYLVFSIWLGVLFLASCSRPPVYPPEPVIEYVGLNQNAIEQSRDASIPLDTIEIRFSFTDGDGDLGSEDSINIFLEDSRDGTIQLFKINPIPKLGAGDALTGEVKILLTNSPITRYFCCTFPNTNLTCLPSKQYPSDILSYQIQIRDRAGNWSNKIRTDPISILCN
ncbi:MAG: hypothetical protein IPH16_11995 [Haliscomenobacter sp.]|nr:hypothetical protein [Haliscomenobacter sp.]MBK7474583.1 hypothetical protein [Haliscomenobacter sp.]MBK8877767.1 hypothetical protein [Haliscomenobacter sp.]